MAAGLADQLSQLHHPLVSGFRSPSSEGIRRLHPPPSRISFGRSSSSYPGLSSTHLLINRRNDFEATLVVSPSPPSATRRRDFSCASASSSGVDRQRKKEQKWVLEGLITESLPNGMFRVRLDNGEEVLGYISGKIRKNSIRIVPGDRVKIEVSRYDSTRGRITIRLQSKDP